MPLTDRNLNSFCKRMLDVLLSSAALIIAAPLMLLIAAAVWLDCPGPVIFAQDRLGLKGKRFRMYKFRKFPSTWGDDGPAVTTKNDVRMTRVGVILERTKLDELPQFWNILEGDMSLVGPRPESPHFADLFKGDYARILEYVPGLFGPNQVIFRNECEVYALYEDPETCYREILFPRKAKADLDYFQRANCLTDLMLILKGMWATLVGVVNWRVFLGRDAGVIVLDALLIAASWFLGNTIWFSGLPGDLCLNIMINGLIIIPLLLVPAMAIGGCYRHPAQYFSLHDALRLVLVLTTSWLAIFILLIGLYRNISLYLAPLTCVIFLIFLSGLRIMRRVKWEKSQAKKQTNYNRIAIYGAGRVGIAIAQLLENGNLIGFLDDDPNLKGKMVAGKRVLGYESDILTILKVRPFTELWLAFMPSDIKLSRLKLLCDRQSIKLYVLPSIEPLSQVFDHPRVKKTLRQ